MEFWHAGNTMNGMQFVFLFFFSRCKFQAKIIMKITIAIVLFQPVIVYLSKMSSKN